MAPGCTTRARTLEAGSISTVSYTKERPIGAIGAVRARVGTTVLMPRTGLHAGGTQYMSLSATSVQTSCRHRDVGTKRIVLLMECAPIHHRRTVAVDWM